MADDTLDGVISNIRACIVSNKGPVLLRNLERDYRTLIGDPIPFRKFKYGSLEDFLRNAPSLRVCGSGGQSTVEADVNSSSKHISDMVSKQKSSKKYATEGAKGAQQDSIPESEVPPPKGGQEEPLGGPRIRRKLPPRFAKLRETMRLQKIAQHQQTHNNNELNTINQEIGFAVKDSAEIHYHTMEKYLQEPTCSKRIEADGMENTHDPTSSEISIDKKTTARKTECLRDKLIFIPEDFQNFAPKPPKITGKIVQPRPAPIIVKPPKHEQNHSMFHGNEPKFVPYEPDKGAVNPIVPQEKKIRKKKSKKSKKSSTIPLPLIEQKLENEILHTESSCSQSKQALESNNEGYEKEIDQLKKENQQLENQLKFQIQVNEDLKNLLVASVGEDMETRFHILTEDKLHLARALLNPAQKFNAHKEQTEWLAGQYEVCRSKFLASSIMVEELAKWKALLTRRVQDLEDMTRNVLEERLRVREYLISTYKDLCVLCDNVYVTSLRSRIHKLNSTNVLDLSKVNMQLSAVVRLQLLGNGFVPTKGADLSHVGSPTTAAEAVAIELLKTPVPELENADAAYSAVMGAAVAVTSSSHLLSPSCSGHCTGEIKTI